MATAGFQTEGGYNGPGEPANNWGEWERHGRVEPSGMALAFFDEWEQHLDRAVAAGCDAFRLSVEWARCEPADGEIDESALARYRAILAGCHERGLLPVVTLHHFTHPGWLGEDFWLGGESPERFGAWVATALGALRGHCDHWVTINEPNILAIQTWLTGEFPPGRTGDFRSVRRAFDHLLAAHIIGYAAIKARQPASVTSINSFPLSLYELDRLLVDVLLARRHGITREDLHHWLRGRRTAYYANLPAPAATARERALRRVAAAAIPLDRAIPTAVDAAYTAAAPCALDQTQIDFYDPVVSHHLRIPGHRTAGGRCWLPGRMLWDDPPDPDGFRRYCQLNQEAGLELWVMENGLCNRVRRGRSWARLDGWDRVDYLRANLAALVSAIDEGVPVGGYFHWTLADNYEWGSYEPRFGLHGIDRERGVRWLEHDSMGMPAAATYRRLIEGLRAGDRSVLDRP